MGSRIKVTGLTKAKNDLKALQKELTNGDRLKAFLQDLANYAQTEVIGYLDEAAYPGTKSFDVKVEQADANRFYVVASGETLLFIEFGSGIKYEQAPDSFYGPGSWSANNAQAIHYPQGFWFYKGEVGQLAEPSTTHEGWNITYGNPGAGALPKAADKTRQVIAATFHRHFG